jgi:uncharacterized protein YxjI
VSECERCGVIFAKIGQARPTQPPPTSPPPLADNPQMQSMLSSDRLHIKQYHRHWLEILTNFEQRNQYDVTDVMHRSVGAVVEQGSGFFAAVVRILAGSHRPFEITVFDSNNQEVLEFSRQFFFLFSDMEVKGPLGQPYGRIRRRFAVLRRLYDLEDKHGRVFARINSPLFKIWTFPIKDDSGRELAVISKKWSGMGKEMFTDADNFGVDFGNHPWTAEQRAVIFAAAIAVDFDFFENNQQR